MVMMTSIFVTMCTLSMAFYSVFHVMGCVKIEPEHTKIITNDTESEVTLKCNYTTSIKDSPQIEWYLRHSGRDEQVMRVSTRGKITKGENFTDRVGRGESAALILKDPKEKDSGTYSCEVIITEDVPYFARALIELTVLDVDCEKKETCPKCTSAMPSEVGPVVMLVFIWLVPIIQFVFVYSSFFKTHMPRMCKLKVKSVPLTRKQTWVLRAIPAILSILGLVLCFVSMIYLVYFVSSGCLSQPSDFYKTTGYSCGAVALCLSVFALVVDCVYKKLYQKREEKISESPENPSALPLMPSSESSPVLQIQDISKLNVIPPRSISMAKELKNPSSLKINSMVFGPNRVMYLCTDKKVYSWKNGSDDAKSIDLQLRDEELFSVIIEHNELIVSIRSKSKTENCKLLFYNLETRKSNIVVLEFPSYCPWVCVGRDDQLYVTDYDDGKLYRITKSGGIRQKIGAGVLKTPTCVTQNARGEVIVTDSEKHDVCVFAHDDKFLFSLRLGVPMEVDKEWNGPHRVVLGANNNLFVACAFSPMIFVFSEMFRYIGSFHTGGNSSGNPWSLAMAENKSLYVGHDDRIRIYE